MLTPQQVINHFDVANSWAMHPEFLLLKRVVDRAPGRHYTDRAFSAWFWRNVPRVFAFVGVSPEQVPAASAALLELRCDPEPCERARQLMAKQYQRGFAWTDEDRAILKVVSLLVCLWVIAQSSDDE